MYVKLCVCEQETHIPTSALTHRMKFALSSLLKLMESLTSVTPATLTRKTEKIHFVREIGGNLVSSIFRLKLRTESVKEFDNSPYSPDLAPRVKYDFC